MKLTTEQFIEKAKTKHGDIYDYSEVDYINSETKVRINCKEHGMFEQTPHSHLRGYGCSKCGFIKTANYKILTNEQFIEKAKTKHEDKYDYSNVNYIKSNAKVIIICNKHGKFEQTPNSHIRGAGCSKCSGNYSPTTEQFIENAKTIHGDKYDYSYVVYINDTTKVSIICKEHGPFEQSAGTHLQGSGCLKCGGRYSPTTEQFIENAKTIHGDTYDYSYVNYVNSNTKVIIICKEHGEFEQSAGTHLQGSGCLKCGGRYSPTTEQFIENAKTIHGDTYDYSYVNYVNSNTKVIIICKEHGEFEQSPGNHLQWHECSKCGFIKTANSQRYTTEEWIEKAKTIHIDKYDYLNVNYINQDTKVIIICKEHGPFEQFPGNHLRGARCFKCYGTCSPTTEEWIEKAKTVHGDKYDYSEVNYTNNRLKVRIICKEHGEFEQSPHDHLRCRGCSKCSRKYSQGQIEWLEYMKITIPDIRHILNHTDGEFRIPNSQYHADGYSEQNRLILEYHGDFWHGNPDIYTNQDEINPVTKTTYGELYVGTIKKQIFCEDAGYNYYSIWESKWIHGKNALIIIQQKYKNK
jgi:ribosomal protein L36